MKSQTLTSSTFLRLCNKEIVGILALGIWLLWLAPYYYASDFSLNIITGGLVIALIWFIASRKGMITTSYFVAFPGIVIWMIWQIFAWARVSRVLFTGIRITFGSLSNFIVLLELLLLLAWGGLLFVIYLHRKFIFEDKLFWFSIVTMMIGLAVILAMNRQMGHCAGMWATLFDLPCFLQVDSNPIFLWLLSVILLLTPMLMAWHKLQEDSMLAGVILSSWAPVWLDFFYYPYQTLGFNSSDMTATLMAVLRSFHIGTSFIAISVFLIALPAILFCNIPQKLKLVILLSVPGISLLSIHLLFIRFLIISGKLADSWLQIFSFGIQLLIFWLVFVVFIVLMIRRFSSKQNS